MSHCVLKSPRIGRPEICMAALVVGHIATPHWQERENRTVLRGPGMVQTEKNEWEAKGR